MPTRRFLVKKAGHLCAAAIAAGAGLSSAAEPPQAASGQRFLLVGLVGSENPTRANFPFVWAAALKEAGNDVRIELAGDAYGFDAHGGLQQRNPGWMAALQPGPSERGRPQNSSLCLTEVRGCPRVVDSDFGGKNAQFTNPKLTAESMGWATKVLIV